MMKTPAFWSHRGTAAIGLLPLTMLWRVAGALKAATARPFKPAIPVVCVGNLTAGGTGKGRRHRRLTTEPVRQCATENARAAACLRPITLPTGRV